jgi:hypothetical protein
MVVLMLLLAFSAPPPRHHEYDGYDKWEHDKPPHEWGHDKHANSHGHEWESMTEKLGRKDTTAPTLRGAKSFMLVDPKTGELTPTAVVHPTLRGAKAFMRVDPKTGELTPTAVVHQKAPPLPGCVKTEVKADGIWCLKSEDHSTWFLKQPLKKARLEHQDYSKARPPGSRGPPGPPAVLMVLLLVAFFWFANSLCGRGEFELPEDGAMGSGDHEMTASTSPTPTPYAPNAPADDDDPPMALPVGEDVDEFAAAGI